MKQAITVPKREPGESHKAYGERVRQWLRESQMPRVKGDLQDWTGSYPFHLNREPQTPIRRCREQ